jgi:transposase InsO family protein
MKRAQADSVVKRNMPIVKRIEAIKADHPYWGYRRTWAHLKFVDGLNVNKKRILRLMQKHHLLVKDNGKLKAVRAVRSKPRPDKPNQWWGIDMTKVMVNDFGWMYIVVVLDWYTKQITGYYAGMQCLSKHWLEALNDGVQQQFPDGVRGQGLHLMSDNGSQPTSLNLMQTCRCLDIQQAFTSYNNPKGNADTERVFRTMKEELLWLREWHSPFELTDSLGKWVEYYNNHYLHSALGYTTPNQFKEEYRNRQISPISTP